VGVRSHVPPASNRRFALPFDLVDIVDRAGRFVTGFRSISNLAGRFGTAGLRCGRCSTFFSKDFSKADFLAVAPTPLLLLFSVLLIFLGDLVLRLGALGADFVAFVDLSVATGLDAGSTGSGRAGEERARKKINKQSGRHGKRPEIRTFLLSLLLLFSQCVPTITGITTLRPILRCLAQPQNVFPSTRLL
jgi:hypothetical protein